MLDGSLGFAAGVMLAASYWSLLEPAIDMASDSGTYGPEGEYAFVPVAIGFFLGAAFVQASDFAMSRAGADSPLALVLGSSTSSDGSLYPDSSPNSSHSSTYEMPGNSSL